MDFATCDGNELLRNMRGNTRSMSGNGGDDALMEGDINCVC